MLLLLLLMCFFCHRLFTSLFFVYSHHFNVSINGINFDVCVQISINIEYQMFISLHTGCGFMYFCGPYTQQTKKKRKSNQVRHGRLNSLIVSHRIEFDTITIFFGVILDKDFSTYYCIFVFNDLKPEIKEKKKIKLKNILDEMMRTNVNGCVTLLIFRLNMFTS